MGTRTILVLAAKNIVGKRALFDFTEQRRLLAHWATSMGLGKRAAEQFADKWLPSPEFTSLLERFASFGQ